MKVAIFGNGSYKDVCFYAEYLKHYQPQLTLCADGGLKIMSKLGRVPDVLLGDFDSVATADLEQMKQKTTVMTYEKRKDFTDVQLCMQYAIEQKCTEMVLFGVLGTRADHSLVNIYLLKYAFDHGIKAKIVNEYNEIFVMEKYMMLENVAHKTISVLPYSDVIRGISFKGMSYPLTNAEMKKENPYGISNYACEDIVEIKIEKGMAIIVITEEKY